MNPDEAERHRGGHLAQKLSTPVEERGVSGDLRCGLLGHRMRAVAVGLPPVVAVGLLGIVKPR